MNKNKTIPNWAWDLYQAKQGEARSCPNDLIEETLNFLMRVFTTGNTPKEVSTLERMIDNHLAGHRQKVRRRTRLIEENLVLMARAGDSQEQLSDSLAIVQRSVTASQWDLLMGLANGDSYMQLCDRCGWSVASAKSAVCRIRKRLRRLAFAV